MRPLQVYNQIQYGENLYKGDLLLWTTWHIYQSVYQLICPPSYLHLILPYFFKYQVHIL